MLLFKMFFVYKYIKIIFFIFDIITSKMIKKYIKNINLKLKKI
jgi:hypothetical protein